ncbi:MAG: hypothetical protein A2Y24_08525 [Clostridiales bacterium GWE2_32_10]|nr:MAG: hypothetical protein A2Y24_08525 [Clostridiales bacterium GWE2_32_10]HBY20616.1 hypothetical protein [Clostridiales bacterium]
MEAIALKTDTNFLNLKIQTSFENKNKQGGFEEIFKTSKADLEPNKSIDKKTKVDNKKEKDVNNEDTENKIDKKESPGLEKVEKVEKVEKTEKTKKVEETDNTEISDDEEKLKEIVEKLGITEEELTNILQSLNIKIDDIKNLDQIKSIVKGVFNLQTDNDILKNSNISDVLKSIKEILGVEDTPEAGLQVVNQDLLSGEKDNNKKVSAKNNETRNTDTKNIDTVEENNQDTKTLNFEQNTSKSEQQTSDNSNNKEKGKDALDKAEKDSNKSIKIEFTDKNNNIIETNDKSIMKNEKIDDINIVTKQSKSLEPQNLMKQILEKAKVTLSSEKSEIVIKLKPESLGKLTMSVVTEEGMLKAKFVAETQKIKETIESNLEDLKQNLKERGLSLDSVEVSVRQDNSNEQQSLFKQELVKSKTYKKNIIDKLMNINSLDETGLREIKNSYLVSENQFNYIA